MYCLNIKRNNVKNIFWCHKKFRIDTVLRRKWRFNINTTNLAMKIKKKRKLWHIRKNIFEIDQIYIQYIYFLLIFIYTWYIYIW